MDIWSIAKYRHEIESIEGRTRLAAVVVVSDYPSSCLSSLCTYPQLLVRSAQLAFHLVFNLGLRKGDRFAVMMRNSQEVLELHFAAAACHLVLVNINTSLAASEMKHILNDSEPRVLFAERGFHAVIRDALVEGLESEIEHVFWSGSTSRAASKQFSKTGKTRHHRYSDCFPRTRFNFLKFESWRLQVASRLGFSPEDPYQMYYTSGTTGRPKGVVLSQVSPKDLSYYSFILFATPI